MLKKFLAARGYGAIDDLARLAYKRGDAIFTNKFHPRPTKNDTDLALAIADVEAVGWVLVNQQAEGEGLTRFVSLTFRRREDGV
ncbi:hypothetical protein [Streptomyces sp. NTK 937]|uniref:hypothetical protein n=1 Tax=Streptomyces sp. NTK 937 TaxID=1487711 RepID=UPI0004A99674|nr:hypothetical protein [Streptomyces sp. NTK 937]KDQ65696.1 hypothetical protein DT87_00075 [Streptomyces sp. NTK 937]KDQ65775.1 hypothetical protein DT87_00530 [Streptomyces sp. NTK 937]